MKTCNKCKCDLSLVEFGKNKRMADGHQRTCKKCAKKYHSEWLSNNQDKRVKHLRKYSKNNPDRIKESRDKYHKANKEKSKQYYIANKDRIKAKNALRKKERIEYNRQWRKENPDRTRENNKRYCLENPEIVEMRSVIKRAERGDKTALEIYGLPSRDKVKEVRDAKVEIYEKYFNGVDRHLDHMKPIVEARGDIEEMQRRSRFTNLVYIPAKANMNKSAKPFWEWFCALDDDKLKLCIAEQDAYNKKIERELSL